MSPTRRSARHPASAVPSARRIGARRAIDRQSAQKHPSICRSQTHPFVPVSEANQSNHNKHGAEALLDRHPSLVEFLWLRVSQERSGRYRFAATPNLWRREALTFSAAGRPNGSSPLEVSDSKFEIQNECANQERRVLPIPSASRSPHRSTCSSAAFGNPDRSMKYL